MTTIAYKDGVIAYDSRMTSGNLIGSDKWDKRWRCNGYNFFLCGTVADMERFIKEVIAGKKTLIFACSGVMVDPEGRMWMVDSGADDSDEHELVQLPFDTPMSWGSGRDFAIAAMDFGSSAKQAVKYAATRDCGTGGKVNTFKVKKV